MSRALKSTASDLGLTFESSGLSKFVGDNDYIRIETTHVQVFGMNFYL
ncbi:MAG: hypothetical protein ACPG8U_03090 [Candidatus Thalassarchaeaceae archaeon]